MTFDTIKINRCYLDPENWRIENKFKATDFYYAIIHDDEYGDFIYHSIASKGKKQWQFNSIGKLKGSLTNGLTRSGYTTQKMIDNGYIEIKQGIQNLYEN